MKFNTISTPPMDERTYAKEIEHHYLYRPRYHLWTKEEPAIEPGSYLGKEFDVDEFLKNDMYLNTDLDPLTGMIKQKSALSRHTLNNVLDKIDLRKYLLTKHLDQINKSICKTDTSLFELEDFPKGISTGADKRRNSLEMTVNTLEQEKRRVESEAFRDLNLLNKDLQEALGGYVSAQRGEKILKDIEM